MKVNFIANSLELDAESTEPGNTYLMESAPWKNPVVMRLTLSPVQFVILSGPDSGEVVRPTPDTKFKSMLFDLQEVSR